LPFAQSFDLRSEFNRFDVVAPYDNGRIGNWYPNRAAVMGENVPAILVASGAAALGWSGVLCNCSDLGGAGWLPDLCG